MYRIVFNEQTAQFRIEKRGLIGWNFVTDDATGNYLTFTDRAVAEAWVCDHAANPSNDYRRWKVVSDCSD